MRWVFLGIVASGVVALDQLTKALVVSRLALYESWAPVPSLASLFDITYTTNTGVAFGLFQDSGMVFLLIAVVAVIGIIYTYRNLEAQGEWPTRLALGMVLGGALGNLIDRVRLGYVIDFLRLSFWPVFNVADSCIVIGVVLLTALIFWEDYRSRRAGSPDDALSAE